MHDVLIIGGGPAGLAAGLEAVTHGMKPLILEGSDDIGGLCRTYEKDGFRFDVGGHRFFTKNREVGDLWDDLLGDDLLQRQRLSRIYYNNKFFHYPLQIGNAIRGLGAIASARVFLSYVKARLHQTGTDVTFEDWVSRRFGVYLYRTFFKTYTEKVWGIPCSELGADWAAQRIQNLSLGRAIVDAMPIRRSGEVKTLIKQFRYPRRGPGMMVDALRVRIIRGGGEIRTNHYVTQVCHAAGRVVSVEANTPQGSVEIPVKSVINTMPISELIRCLNPSTDPYLKRATESLRYRDFISVNLKINGPSPFPDQWIYVHEPKVNVGRVQSYGNWSSSMVPHDNCAGIGVEYFCFQHDEIWRMETDDPVSYTHLTLPTN